MTLNTKIELDFTDDNCLKKQEEKDRNTLLEVERLVGHDKYEDLIEFIQESGGTINFEITSSHPRENNKQKEDYWFKHIYIEQRVGFLGDDYSGYIWIPIKHKKYLKFYYEC